MPARKALRIHFFVSGPSSPVTFKSVSGQYLGTGHAHEVRVPGSVPGAVVRTGTPSAERGRIEAAV